MDKITDRDIKKALGDAINSNMIKISSKDKYGNLTELKHSNCVCFTCKKNIGNVLNSFVYFIINSKDMINVEEKEFCSRKCWNTFLENEVRIMKKKMRVFGNS